MKRNIKVLGFSLVEVMVAMGLLGAASLTFMQMQKSNISANKRAESRYDVSSFAQDISAVFVDENACKNTFAGKNFVVPAGTSTAFDAIKDGSDGGGQTLYSTGKVIANSVDIVRYEYKVTTTPAAGSTGDFQISFFYKEDSSILRNANTYEKKVDNNFKVQVDGSGAIIKCFSDASHDISGNVKKACEAVGGAFDDATLLCNLNSVGRDFPTGMISDLATNTGDNEGISYGDFSNKIVPNLLDQNFLQYSGGVLEDTLVINGNLLLAHNPTLNKEAVPLGYLENLLQCPAGSSGVFVPSMNAIQCTNLLCPPQHYLAGIDSSGLAVCNPLVDNSAETCSAGGNLRVQPDGSVVFQCCSPTCSDSTNICSGIQYPSANGCGVCVGTKPAVNNEWGAWTDTGQTREAGACVGGLVEMEKKQIRLCEGGNECGVASCSGNDERWVSSGTQSCSSPCTFPPDNSANICVGHCIQQTDTCGNTRILKGTSTATSPACMENAMGPGAQCGSPVLCTNPTNPSFIGDCCPDFKLKACPNSGGACNTTAIFCPVNNSCSCVPLSSGSPVNGGWGSWSSWSSCSGGSQTRTRLCNNPSPSNGGSYCVGSSTQTQSCGGPALPDPCIGGGGSNGGGGMGGVYNGSGGGGSTTDVYQEPCLNPSPMYP